MLGDARIGLSDYEQRYAGRVPVEWIGVVSELPNLEFLQQNFFSASRIVRNAGRYELELDSSAPRLSIADSIPRRSWEGGGNS